MPSNGLTVLKVGGSLLNPEQFPLLLKALAPFLKKNRTVVVHGGGKEITAMCERLGLETRFVNGRRFTDEPMMEVVEMVLGGKVNPYIADQLNALGVPAIGLSGRNARMVVAKPVPELGRVGLPVKVRADLVRSFLDRKLAPIFASIASDGKGGALNINADEMASAIAVALKARRLILFTDVPGVLDASKRTIPAIRFAESRKLIQDGVITGGMIPKIESSFGAIKKGVGEIWILQGRLPLENASGTVLTSKSSTTKHPFA
jgi:acetylglutamate kinase